MVRHYAPEEVKESSSHLPGLLSVSAFETYFKATVADMTPQNRRAFTKMIKLLAE